MSRGIRRVRKWTQGMKCGGDILVCLGCQSKVSQTTAMILMGTDLSSKLFYSSEGSQYLCSFDMGKV